MEKTLTVERCEIGEDFARKHNLGDRKYPAKIIFDHKLGRKRIEEVQAKHEAKCAEIRDQNAEIDERNEVGKVNVEKRNKKKILTGYAVINFCFAVILLILLKIGWQELTDVGVAVSIGEELGYIIVLCVFIGFLCFLSWTVYFEKIVKLEEFTPEEHIEYSDSVESFYTINEFFAKWWKEDFTVLESAYWENHVSRYYRSDRELHEYSLSLLAVDKDDVIHKAYFKFGASPEIVIKRNQSCIEFDLLNNRIIIPYIARED